MSGGLTPDWNGLGLSAGKALGESVSLGSRDSRVEGASASNPKVVVSGVLGDTATPLVGTVVLVNEVMPSWLVLLGNRVSLKTTHQWTHNEAVCVRRSLKLPECGFEYSSEDALCAGAWTAVKEARTVLVSGSSRFCKSVFDTFASLELLRDTDKVLVVSSGRHCFDLPIRSRWTNLYHNSLGGVTCGRSRLAVSLPLLQDG